MLSLCSSRAICCVWIVLAIAAAETSVAQEPNFAGIVDASGFAKLTGKPAQAKIKGRDTVYKGQFGTVTPLVRGGSAIKMIEIQEGRRKRRVKAAEIESLTIGGSAYSLMTYVPNNRLFLVNQDTRRSVAKQQLAATRTRLAPIQPPNNFQTYTEQLLQFANDAAEQLGEEFNVTESQNFIMLSELPETSNESFQQAVEKLISGLNDQFGVQTIGVVGSGKPVVGVFLNRASFEKFAADQLEQTGDIRGHATFSDTKAGFVCAAEGARSPRQLLWETAWGLTALYVDHAHSSQEMPDWFRVGMQGVVADQMFPGVNNARIDLQQAKMALFQNRSLEGLFVADRIAAEWASVAKQLVGFIAKASPEGFEQVFEDMKYGFEFEDAVKTTFGIDKATLVANFGRSMGLPGLRP